MTYRLKQLAPNTTVDQFLATCGITGYSLVGRGKATLDSKRYFASFADARPGTITYYYAADLTKWQDILAKLNAVAPSLLIVNSELSLILEPKPHQTILYCQHPKLLFAKMVEASIYSNVPCFANVVDPSCCVGSQVQIEEGAQLGSNVRIESNCYIHGNVTIGNNVTIKANAVIGGQGFEFYKDDQGTPRHFPHTGRVVIEDDVHIGSGVVIDAAVFDSTIIRRGTKIDNLASIAHNVQIGENCLIMAHASIAGSVRIGDRSRICLAASIRNGLTIGNDTTIGMNACVTRSLPDSVTAYGNPATVVNACTPKQPATPCIGTEVNTARIIRLTREIALERLQLDLTGFNVVTEAATGPFAATACIAALAGAHVQAIASDSPYGSFEEATRATLELAATCGLSNRITIVRREQAAFAAANIITNLGFVRPIDQSLIDRLQPGTVVPLMYDVREIRPGEIDLDACRERGITVVGTNEEHPMANILSYSGPLVIKELLACNIEIEGARIAILGENFFTPHIVKSLENMHADVTVVAHWDQLTDGLLATADAAVFVDYWQKLGPIRGSMAEALLTSMKGIALIQFVGGLDIEPFRAAGWHVTPSEPLAPHRMWKTLGYLGPRPVIELHAAGLKAAELELRCVPHASGTCCDGLRQPIVTHQAVTVAYSC